MKPEEIAVIAAAVAAYLGTANVRITSVRRATFNVWALTGRQEIMAARKF